MKVATDCLYQVLFFLNAFYFVKSGYPPTGDEVQPGSVLLPASRRGRYLANIVRRQAVDGTGIKFNKDADRMNAEAKKKVDVLSDELMPYIMAEQERRVTLYRRVMTAIQNGEKGTTIAEMRNKPPLIIRKGVLYRCPANRSPKEPDGSGALMCEDEITPTQIMYDSCLSAEDRELYRAGDKYFFCNRHRTEGPDLPRNESVVFACDPLERTSLNYTMTKCALEDTDDVVVHFRYYPDRTFKFVNELDPDKEVCDHWNPCQIGYIYRLPSVDQAVPSKDLSQIVPGVPEEVEVEGVHTTTKNYTTGERNIEIPKDHKVSRFVMKKKGASRRSPGTLGVGAQHVVQHLVGSVLYVSFTFASWSSKYYGLYFVVLQNTVTHKERFVKLIELVPSAALVTPSSVVSVHGQSMGFVNVPFTCNRCQLQSVVIRSRDGHMLNMDSTRFTIRTSRGQSIIQLNMKDLRPQEFGDYYAVIVNGDGIEERVRLATVHAPAIVIKPLEESIEIGGHFDSTVKYNCSDCEPSDVLCNGQSVLRAGRVSIVAVSHMVSFNFPRFENENACVYIGFFQRLGKTYVKTLAIIEKLTIPNVTTIIVAPNERFEQEIPFTCSNCRVLEVYVNGLRVPSSEDKGHRGSNKDAYYQSSSSGITITVERLLEEHAGVYQAVFEVDDSNFTKTVLKVIPASDAGEVDPNPGDETKDPSKPGDETVDPSKPGNDTKNPSKPGDETVDPSKPGDDTKDLSKPGDETVDPSKPGDDTKDLSKPEDETVDPPKPGDKSDDTEKPEGNTYHNVHNTDTKDKDKFHGDESANPGDDSKDSSKPGDKSDDSAKPGDDSKDSSNPGDNSDDSAKPGDKSDDSAKPGDNSKDSSKPGDKSDDSAKPGDKSDDSAKPGDKSDDSAKPGDKSDDSAKLGDKSDDSAKAGDNSDDSAKPGDKSDDSAKPGDKSDDSAKPGDDSKDSSKPGDNSNDPPPNNGL